MQNIQIRAAVLLSLWEEQFQLSEQRDKNTFCICFYISFKFVGICCFNNCEEKKKIVCHVIMNIHQYCQLFKCEDKHCLLIYCSDYTESLYNRRQQKKNWKESQQQNVFALMSRVKLCRLVKFWNNWWGPVWDSRKFIGSRNLLLHLGRKTHWRSFVYKTPRGRLIVGENHKRPAAAVVLERFIYFTHIGCKSRRLLWFLIFNSFNLILSELF